MEALGAWGLGPARITPIVSGHINRTFLVEVSSGRFALQRLNAIFGPEVHLDIEAITAELEAAHLLTPRLVPAAGKLWITDRAGATWRMLTFIDGEVVLAADSAQRCASAGELLGRFHRALWSCTHRFRHRRLGIHDTASHLAKLERLLLAHRAHRSFSEVEPVGRAILEDARQLKLEATLPERVVHGDPKISNVIFGADGEARCLIDLDTVARMPLPVELGDALRSWCSPQGEEVEGELDLGFFRAALRGYAEGVGQLPGLEERAAIPAAVEVIAVELAARFCADALEESYFRWDATRFASSCAHNLTRARAQLALARSARERREEMVELAHTLWPGP
jgi:Ser/Thr protein kinase RdoA (MazF antagonist)